MTQNQAAWLNAAKEKPLKVAEAPLVKPGPGQVLIKSAAVAINPIDWKIQTYDVLVKKYPVMLGEDVAGEIVEVGEGVTKFKKGDKVIAHMKGLITGQPEHNGFQLYPIAFANLVAKLPDNVPADTGVVLPLAISTAAAGLYMKSQLGLPYPSKDAKPTGKALLINGASSSVGAVAVQLAVASGFKVIATASPQHHALAKELGATEVFDYRDPKIAEKLVEALKSAGGFAGVYDAISEPSTLEMCATVTQKLGGGFMTCTLSPPEKLPEGVKAAWCSAPAIADQEPEVAEAVWGQYVPAALADGSFKCKPDKLVVGHGLESVQAGVDRQQKGVSGQKVVITL